MYVFVLIAFLLAQAAPVFAIPQDADETQDSAPAQERGGRRGRFAELQKKIQTLIESTKSLNNWDEHAQYSREAVSKFFERAGWDSAEDSFAQELFRAVDSQPPWDPQKRANVFFGLLSDRYQLDDDQRARLQEITVRTAIRVFAAQGDKILEYVPEMIQSRAAGEPFTAEQIARWSKVAEPVIEYASQRVEEAAEEFMDDLRPEQRDQLALDLSAGRRRVEMVREFMVDWKAGHWEPSDWGMEDDPIQIGKVAMANEAAQAGVGQPGGETGQQGHSGQESPVSQGNPAEPTPGTPEPPNAPESGVVQPAEPTGKPRKVVVSIADDPWSKYVVAFIAKYSLDDRQSQQAALIGEEASKRADEASGRSAKADAASAKEIAAKPLSEKTVSELEKIFGKMKLRLERLPTRAQRKAASGIELPDLDFSGKPAAKTGDSPRSGRHRPARSAKPEKP